MCSLARIVLHKHYTFSTDVTLQARKAGLGRVKYGLVVEERAKVGHHVIYRPLQDILIRLLSFSVHASSPLFQRYRTSSDARQALSYAQGTLSELINTGAQLRQ